VAVCSGAQQRRLSLNAFESLDTLLQDTVMQMPPKTKASVSDAGGAPKNPWWKAPEVTKLLECVKKVLPMGEYHWQEVAHAYNTGRPQGAVERNVDSCKTKFKSLKSTKKCTGVAQIPWDVAEAKQIQREIEAKMCSADLDDQQEGEQNNSDDGANDEEEEAGGDQHSSSESESENDGFGNGQQQQQQSSPVTSGEKRRVNLTSSSNSPKQLEGTPSRLGITEKRTGAVASTATAKRARLDKEIKQEKDQRNAAADARMSMMTTMMQQQSQQFALQMQQQQQMSMMMMMMLSKMSGVAVPQLPQPILPQSPMPQSDNNE
jgi:hypothetical protein